MASSFSFNVLTSSKRDALWFENYFRTSLLRKIRTITQWAFFGLVALFLVTFVPEGMVSAQTSRVILGITLLLLAYGLAIFLLEQFGESLKRPKSSFAGDNLAEQVSFEVARIAHRAVTYAKKKGLMQVDSSVLLHMFLEESGSAKFLFRRLLLDLEGFQRAVSDALTNAPVHPAKRRQAPFAPDFAKTMQTAVERAQQKGRIQAESEDVFAALAVHNPLLNRYVVEEGFVPERDIPNIAQWHYRLRKTIAEDKKFWLKKNLRKYGTLGTNWAAGYTITLDQFSFDISKQVRAAGFPRAVGHEKEKIAMQRALSQRRVNNVLLVGNPGSGRRRLVEDFASQSVLGEHESPLLNYKRVVELDLARLAASLQTMEEAEAVLEQAFHEVTAAGNIILVLDDFHNFVGEGLAAAPGRVNIAGVLSSYLRSPQFPLIAVTTFPGLHRYIEQNPSLLSFFQQVEVTELSQEETLAVLEEMVPLFESIHNKFISYPALQAIVAYADKYIQATPFPKKAIDLLDESTSFIATTADQVLVPAHVATVVAERTQIPVGDIEGAERETLLDLEQLIHRRIVNQDEAVKEVASALRRARTEVASRQGPMGSFLFLGPTGVGKTETAKALAAIYFGSEARMIRLDMSEFQSVRDIDRLLGTADQEGLLTTAVRQDPFSLLLLDELEKAHPNILNLFLQVLDEGHVTDGLGRKTDFRHTIIIATSNAGYQLILQALREKKDFAALKGEMLEYVFQEGLYRPEFINRFDGVILFTPLSREHLLQIAGLMLGRLQQNLKEKGIGLEITEPLKAKIAQLGYDPMFGARNMRRVLQDKVENSLAVALLANKVKRGDRITVDPTTFEVKSKV